MKFFNLFLFIIVYFHFSHFIFAQNNAKFQAKIDELIYERLDIDFARSPGFIVGIIQEDSIFIFPYGSTSKDSIIVPRADDLFEIGNLTNLFTARLINILEEEKKLDKTISINNYLPDSLKNSTATEVTIEQLLTHVSGLPRVPLGIGLTQKEDNQPYAFYTKKELGNYFKGYNFSIAETGKYNYSHLGYALLEIIIEHLTAEKFAIVLQKKLLKDRFLSTEFELNSEERAFLVQGFDKSHAPTLPWKYASFGSAVGLKSNMNDLLIFLRDQIDTNIYDKMHQKIVPTGMKKNVSAGEGWHVIQPKKYYPIVLHTGATNGHRGYMAFVKETRTGVVVLSNSEFALRGLGYFILEEMNEGFRKKR